MARLASGLIAGDDRMTSARTDFIGTDRQQMDDRLYPSAVRGGGLYLRQGETVLKGFAICDSNRVFVKADARILYGVRVLVWHDQINDPVSLTYGFSAFNGDANLLGSDGIPVLPLELT